jgi:hypothetical protein
MKTTLMLAMLLLSPHESPAGHDRLELLSWYDGWGTHSVWGFGKVSGSYKNAFATCGDLRIPIKAVYDTHMRTAEPVGAQLIDSIRLANASTIKQLEASGEECDWPTAIADEA